MIKNEQDLLNKYYNSECSVISEWSSQIQADTDELDRAVTEYAERRGLQTPVESA
jgi:hypothetical protein